MKKIVFTLAFLAAISNAQAQTPAAAPKTVSAFVGMGITVGGDKLASLRYTDGDKVDIRGGGGPIFTAGLDYQVNPQFSVQGTINYHVDQANASNGDVKFQRFPVEGLVFYHPGNGWKFGGGLRYVSSPKLKSSGAANFGTFSFKNTVSAVAEAEYMFDTRVSMKLRFVNEKFDLKNSTGKISANHVGVSGNYYF